MIRFRYFESTPAWAPERVPAGVRVCIVYPTRERRELEEWAEGRGIPPHAIRDTYPRRGGGEWSHLCPRLYLWGSRLQLCGRGVTFDVAAQDWEAYAARAMGLTLAHDTQD